MINFIEGTLITKEEGHIIVACGGIGYEIFVSNKTLSELPYNNEICRILTYMQVKEDGISLFGFSSKDEKDMFLELISVSGIGPKVAMGILSGISLNELIMAISSQDVKMLCTVKGLGKKTAERLLVELKDKVSPVQAFAPKSQANQTAIELATEALETLGVGKNEAYRLALSYADENTTVEEIITKALRGMGK